MNGQRPGVAGHRLLIEPRRLWKRYIIGNPLFIWRVIKQRLGLLHFDET